MAMSNLCLNCSLPVSQGFRDDFTVTNFKYCSKQCSKTAKILDKISGVGYNRRGSENFNGTKSS